MKGGKMHEGKNGRLGFSKEDRGKIWKEYMEVIMNE